jgi:hypothetical protein
MTYLKTLDSADKFNTGVVEILSDEGGSYYAELK